MNHWPYNEREFSGIVRNQAMRVIRTHYLDASALVKLFIDEDGSAAVRNYLEPHATRVTTVLCFAETLGVLKAKHAHKHITIDKYLSACEDMMGCLRGQTLTIEDIGITDRLVFDEVERLAKAHALDLSDACQLLTLRQGALSTLEGDSRPILITADKKLGAAARSEGLRVWDCMNEAAP